MDDALQGYAESRSTADEGFLAELAEQIVAELPYPAMLSGPLVGRLLELLAHTIRPRLVVEIGTYGGYSALAMAAAMPADARLVTCELDPTHAAFARRAFERAGETRIELREGPALETLQTLDGPYDLVFIDAEKTGYPGYYEAVVPKLSPHGVIAVDNTLRGGSVLDPGDDETANAVAAFNDLVAADPRTRQALLPVRDGVTLIRLAPDPA